MLTDLSEYNDARIHKLENPILKLVLILFKHHGEDGYTRDNFYKIFQDTENLVENEESRNLIESFYVYLTKTSEFEMKELKVFAEDLPPKTKNIAMSTYDLFVAAGKKEGREEGQIKSYFKIICDGMEMDIETFILMKFTGFPEEKILKIMDGVKRHDVPFLIALIPLPEEDVLEVLDDWEKGQQK